MKAVRCIARPWRPILARASCQRGHCNANICSCRKAPRSCTPTLDSFFASVEQRDDPRAARPAGDRRRRGGARGELRGQGVRHPHGDERIAGPPAVPAGDRRRAAVLGLHRGEPGGVPRCSRTRRRWWRGCRSTRRSSTCAGWSGSSGTPAEIAVRLRAEVLERGGAADHGRRGSDEVPGEGGQRRRQARRPAGGAAGWRARVPASAAGRAAMGRRQGDGRQAPLARDRDGGAGGRARRGGARLAAGPGVGPALHALAHNRDPRRVQVGRRRRLDRRAARARPRRRSRRRRSTPRWSRWSTASRAGCAPRGRVGRTVVLRLRFDDFTRATRSHTLPRATAQHRDDPRDRARGCWRARRR